MAAQGSFPCTAGRGRPVTVDFIDHELPGQHPLFLNPPVKYDQASGQYALISRQHTPGSQAFPDGDVLPSRPDWTSIKAMKFWNEIFPGAMAEFRVTNEPQGRSSTSYSIRTLNSWDEVYQTLQKARQSYLEVGGRTGWLKQLRRTMADKSTPLPEAKLSTKVAPSDSIVTPVFAAVEMVLDAVKIAASVRQRATHALKDPIPIFSDVELFLATFPGDVRIRRASLDLTVATLDAIERTIGFFISTELLRGAKALFAAGDYEKSMVDSLDMIKTRSSSLMEEAVKSHIHSVHMYSQETQRLQRQLSQNVSEGFNALNKLIQEYMLRRDREETVQRQEMLRLQVENERLRAATPLQQGWWPPPPPAMEESHISPDGLRRILDSPDLDLADLAFVDDKKGQLQAMERAQAEQIVNTQPFRAWILSTSSTRLLVQWDLKPPQTIADVSPLSAFCATMARALRATERFVSTVWFCGQHIDPDEAGGHVGGRAMLASLVSQLLRQHIFDLRPMYIDVTALQAGNLDALIQLLDWLVWQLPKNKTLFCVVDGVYLLERDEFKREALPVLQSLIRLASDLSVPATVKLLLTSTPGTDVVRGAFEEEDLILDVSGLPQLGWAPSDERMMREFQGEMGEAAQNVGD